MLGTASKESYEIVNEVYSESFLNDIFERLSLVDDIKISEFKELLIHATAKYISFKNSNTDRIPKNQQTKKLKAYKSALNDLEKSYDSLLSDDTSSAKYHRAIREKLELLPEHSPLIEMLSPYVTITRGENLGGGTSPAIWGDLLVFMQDAAEAAKDLYLGDGRTDLTKKFLTWWVAIIRQHWPNSNITFSLGDYIKEIGSYKSEALEILYALIHPIDPQISKRSLATAMENVGKTHINQYPAYFLIN